LLSVIAARRPHAAALHVARDISTITYGALDAAVSALAGGLASAGLRAGDRALVMLHPGPGLVTAAFALLRMGAVPVLVDPGLGIARMLSCIEGAAPRGMIGVPALHAARLVRSRAFRSVEVAVSSSPFPGTHGLGALMRVRSAPPRTDDLRLDDVAMIAFTTGSTGEPKGVCYSHRTLHAQVRSFAEVAAIGEGCVQLALLPLMAILGPGLGCATVVPELSTRHPAAIDPVKILATIRRYHVTHAFGSPTPWGILAAHCEAVGATLPSLRRVILGGAPVSAALVARLQRLVGAAGEVRVAYGATEAVPLSQAPGDEVIEAATRAPGRGTLVGRAASGVEMRVVRVVDGPIAAMGEGVLAPRGEIGEVVVRSGVVTPAYFERPDADRLAKIPDEGGPWHRMGDLGWLDDDGRLWFCGRKADRVETASGTLHTACVEPAFEAHPDVARAALVGVGARPRQRPVLVVEPAQGRARGAAARAALAGSLRAIGEAHAARTGTPAVRDVLFHHGLPLDVRHDAKILRHELVAWAERRTA
jgi:acyl-CoA synthetase (AMP-forming)/AMP-acid ligase II